MCSTSSLPAKTTDLNDIGELQTKGAQKRYAKHKDLIALYKQAYTEREIREMYVLTSKAIAMLMTANIR